MPQEVGIEDADLEEISISEDFEEEPVDYYRCDPDEEETRYSEKFRTVPGPDIGCFGAIVMYFVNKKQEKVRMNHKSLISRNQRFKRGMNRSMKKLKDRTVSMMSIASTNWKSSRMHLAESMTNLSMRSRRPSKAETLPGRTRHMSMQDRLEIYNEELDTETVVPPPRVRKVSKVAFEGPTVPQVVTPSLANEIHVPAAHVPAVHVPAVHIPPVRTRKVSKVSMFEFVPEEREKPKDRPQSLDVPQ